ncbi:hypothetical protein NEOLEDRAFT_1183200 [Neolentinus lepideus HHB14362 ss-1]|uniref:Uncharacterized protein n=1 Tax=Neolentinus lepideus HHB14362 ss-1 TaxID=1314782 RepID=A0A165NH95_9AGAM|nr:hypothetical protein NEOLEDRAFT_1183200 [Neolentinus lepideus HHB14362 ss-1]
MFRRPPSSQVKSSTFPVLPSHTSRPITALTRTSSPSTSPLPPPSPPSREFPDQKEEDAYHISPLDLLMLELILYLHSNVSFNLACIYNGLLYIGNCGAAVHAKPVLGRGEVASKG